MLYNFSEYTPPASILTQADATAVRTAIQQYRAKRRLLVSITDSRKKSKNQDGEQPSTSTNMGHSMINALLDVGYDVEMPPNADDVNVLIPLSWVCVDILRERQFFFFAVCDVDFFKSPNTAFGSRIVDGLPIVAKLVSNEEAAIIKKLNSDEYRMPTNHTVPLLDVVHIGSDEVLIMPYYDALNETTPQCLDDVVRFTKQLLEV
jgi:hypothetical protein